MYDQAVRNWSKYTNCSDVHELYSSKVATEAKPLGPCISVTVLGFQADYLKLLERWGDMSLGEV